VSAPVESEPLRLLLPDQAPEALQEAAWLEDQLKVDEAPLAMLLGAAVSVTVGASCAIDTMTCCVATPPGPSQVSR
jgi:hypothetical protein